MYSYCCSYVVALETKIKQLEALVAELHPGEDFSYRVGKRLTRRNWMQSGVLGDINTTPEDPSPPAPHLPPVDPGSMNPDSREESLQEERDVISKLADLMLDHKRIHLANFYGSSSSQRLIASAIALQNTNANASVADHRLQFLRSLRPDFWCELPVGRDTSGSSLANPLIFVLVGTSV